MGLRLPEALEWEIQRHAERGGQTWTSAAVELLSEGVRMRRAPGIVFADGPSGRRAVIAGTGIDVWEVIAAWRTGSESFDAPRESYPWLGEAQLRAALGYYELYAEEIDRRLDREREWTLQRVRQEMPFATPRRGRG